MASAAPLSVSAPGCMNANRALCRNTATGEHGTLARTGRQHSDKQPARGRLIFTGKWWLRGVCAGTGSYDSKAQLGMGRSPFPFQGEVPRRKAGGSIRGRAQAAAREGLCRGRTHRQRWPSRRRPATAASSGRTETTLLRKAGNSVAQLKATQSLVSWALLPGSSRSKAAHGLHRQPARSQRSWMALCGADQGVSSVALTQAWESLREDLARPGQQGAPDQQDGGKDGCFLRSPRKGG